MARLRDTVEREVADVDVDQLNLRKSQKLCHKVENSQVKVRAKG